MFSFSSTKFNNLILILNFRRSPHYIVRESVYIGGSINTFDRRDINQTINVIF